MPACGPPGSREPSLDLCRCPDQRSGGDPAPAAVTPQARVSLVPRGDGTCLEALGEGVAAGQRSVRAWDLTTPCATELLPKNIRVGLRRARRDAETACDLFVGTSGGDQLDHLTLPIRDDRRPLM